MPVLAWTGPEGSRMSKRPEFLNSNHTKVVRLSALCTSRLNPQGSIYVRGWVDPRTTVRPEGLCWWRIAMAPAGIAGSAVAQPIAPLSVLGQMGSTWYSRVLVASDLTDSVVASIQRWTFSGWLNECWLLRTSVSSSWSLSQAVGQFRMLNIQTSEWHTEL